MSSAEHKKYLNEAFYVQPAKLFSQEELSILESYGRWMLALMREEILPETDAQRHFLVVCKGGAEATTPHERAWVKYIARKRWERANPDYVGASGVREADPGWTGHYRAEDQNGGYSLARKKYES